MCHIVCMIQKEFQYSSNQLTITMECDDVRSHENLNSKQWNLKKGDESDDHACMMMIECVFVCLFCSLID